MLQALLKRKEEKYIRHVQSKLMAERPGTSATFEAVPCHNDPRFLHLGLNYKSETGQEVHQHICFSEYSVGALYSTKSDFQKEQYKWVWTEASAEACATLMINAFWHWTMLVENGWADQSEWDYIYPGVPYIGDNAYFSDDFVFPSVQSQFEHLMYRLNSGEISLDKFEKFKDLLNRKY